MYFPILWCNIKLTAANGGRIKNNVLHYMTNNEMKYLDIWRFCIKIYSTLLKQICPVQYMAIVQNQQIILHFFIL